MMCAQNCNGYGNVPEGQTASFSSPTFIIDDTMFLTFQYHMTGADVGRFKVKLMNDHGSHEIFSAFGDQTNVWHHVCRPLPASTNTRLVFVSEHGQGCNGAVQFDNVDITATKCLSKY